MENIRIFTLSLAKNISDDNSDEFGALLMSPLQKIASGDESIFKMLLATMPGVTSLPGTAAVANGASMSSAAGAAYQRRGVHTTPLAGAVAQLAYVGSESLEVPYAWHCGKCTERAVGRFCHNCGAEYAASPIRREPKYGNLSA